MAVKEQLHLGVIYLKCLLRERRRWRGNRTDSAYPRIYYGHDEIPDRNQIASGGIVKIQDLLTCFPNTQEGANIVYLVSSALPHYAHVMLSNAKKSGCKIVVNQNGTASLGWYGEGWQAANRPLQRVLNMADYVVYQSRFCKEAADVHLGRRNTQFEILYNPVDTDFFIPLDDGNRSARLLLAGSHHQFYRVQSAVDAFYHLFPSEPEARLTIAGKYRWCSSEKESLDQLHQYIHEKGLTEYISVEGAYTQEEARSLFHRHDILLHTKYNDPCPRLVVEALASGLPVVYSESGGVPELVGDAGIGIPAPYDWQKLYPPDPDLLAKAVKQINGDYAVFSRLARQRALTHFDVKPWLERHAEIFHSLLM